jgi:hypothetical protein
VQGDGMSDWENPKIETESKAIVNSDFFIVFILVKPKGGESICQLRSMKKDWTYLSNYFLSVYDLYNNYI